MSKVIKIKTLSQLIDHLEAGVERTEDADWCVLQLNADEANDLLPNLKQCLSILYEKQDPEDSLDL